MKAIFFTLFVFLSINIFSQERLYISDHFYMLKFETKFEADSCVKLFYNEGIYKQIIDKDNEYYIEIDKDEFKMKSVNHKGFVLPKQWRRNIEYFEIMKIGESRIGEGFIN